MTAQSVDDRLAGLRSMDNPALRVEWQRVHQRPPPRRISRDLLLHSLASQVQAEAYGGVGRALARRLVVLGDSEQASSGSAANFATVAPRPGTRLVREWRGEAHKVDVLDDGFAYRGERYTSLSQIARRITGTRWSGPRFFGLTTASESADG